MNRIQRETKEFLRGYKFIRTAKDNRQIWEDYNGARVIVDWKTGKIETYETNW